MERRLDAWEDIRISALVPIVRKESTALGGFAEVPVFGTDELAAAEKVLDETCWAIPRQAQDPRTLSRRTCFDFVDAEACGD
jgi:hypothetical protein